MAEFTAGSLFAGHRIEALRGHGGMGVVYRATHLELDRTVALKVIAPALVEDSATRQRFLRESRLAASIDHPNVIPIYYTGEEDGTAFIAMRFVQGRDLRSLVREHGALEPDRAAQIVSQVAAALDAAHAAGLVHRDVKPANVLLGPADHVYLSDFGLSKRMASVSGETRSGHWVGTLDYVAPEQIRGERLDARADVYALGGVLYFALTGHAPFPHEGDEAKLWAQLTEPPPRASDHVPGLSPAFDAVIVRALAKRPGGRFPSAGDLGRATLSAAGIELPAQPERAVGTGAAAPEETPTESAPMREAAAAKRAEALTEVVPPPRGRGRMRAAVAVAILGLVAAGVAAALLLRSGDSGSQATATVTVTATRATPRKPAVPAVVSHVRVGGRPNGIAVGKGLVFATDFNKPRVMLVDERTAKRRGRGPTVGIGSRDVAVGLGAAWVAASRQNALFKLDAATGKPLARIALPYRPQTIAVGHGAVWVGMSMLAGSSTLTPAIPDSLAQIDPHTNAVKRTFPMAAGIRAVASTPHGLWIANRRYPAVSRFNVATGKIDKRVILSDSALDGAYSSGAVWFVLPGDTVVRIDDKTGRNLSIGVGRHPTGVAAKGKQIWVTSFIDHTITRIDPKTTRPVGEPVPVSLNPYRLAATRDSIWLTAVGEGDIARVRYRAAG